MPTLIGAFDRPQSARQALDRLTERGIARNDIREVDVRGTAAVVVALPDDAAQLQTAERTLSELGASVQRKEDGRSTSVVPEPPRRE